MKNSINLVLVIFIAVVLGCTCQTTRETNTTQNNNTSINSSKPEKPDEKATPKNDVFSSNSTNNSDQDQEDFDKELDDLDKKLNDLKKQTENSTKPSVSNKTDSTKNESGDSDKPTASDNKIPTMAQFKSIRQGMTYDEVVDILGNNGNLIKQQGTMKRYLWGDDDSFIMISFENNRVAMATQNNLK